MCHQRYSMITAVESTDHTLKLDPGDNNGPSQKVQNNVGLSLSVSGH